MPVTIKDIKYFFNSDSVEQVKSMQLFIVNNNILVSYRTIIGMMDTNECWHITNRKYSSSTSRQTTVFKRSNYHVIVDDIVLDSMQAYYYPNGV